MLDALAGRPARDAARTDDGLDVDVLAARPGGPAHAARCGPPRSPRAARPGALHRVHVLAVDALVTDWHGQGPVALPGGVAARRACGRLALGPAPASSREHAGDGLEHDEE